MHLLPTQVQFASWRLRFRVLLDSGILHRLYITRRKSKLSLGLLKRDLPARLGEERLLFLVAVSS